MDKFLKGIRSQLLTIIETYSRDKLTSTLSTPSNLVNNNSKVANNETISKIFWVVGNEAADLDSIISCLGFSFLQSSLYEQNSNEAKLLIPLINIPRNDLNLRPEVKFVFDFCKILTENLFFIDDPLVTRWEELLTEQLKEVNSPALLNPNFILMDHNKLHRRFESWKGIVKIIYDHHQDEKYHLDANPRIIKLVGSNTSLIVEWWRSKISNSEQLEKIICTKLACLMLAPILVDTVNLKGEYGRVTDCDLNMSAYLNLHIDSQECSDEKIQFVSKDDYFEKIDKAKTDVSHMTSGQLLRKDFKLWLIPQSNLKLGMSSIVNWCYTEWQERSNNNPIGSSEDPFSSMSAFASQRELDVLVVLGFKQYNNGADSLFEREFYIYTPNPSLLQYLHKNLSQEKALGLVPIDDLAFVSKGYVFYLQSVLSASRKVSYPILRDLITSFNQ